MHIYLFLKEKEQVLLAYFGKHLEAGAGVAGGSNHDARILHTRPAVFVVHVAFHTYHGKANYKGK